MNVENEKTTNHWVSTLCNVLSVGHTTRVFLVWRVLPDTALGFENRKRYKL